tara:strand:+ start:856 stop:1896 length:1041 start_codon:yes stop_codon:yes gene_type:complete
MAIYIPKPLQGLTYQPSPAAQDLTEKLGRVVGPAGAVVLASRAIGAARGKFTDRKKPGKSLKDKFKPFVDTGFPDSNPEWEDYKVKFEAGIGQAIDNTGKARPGNSIDNYKPEPINFDDTLLRTEITGNNTTNITIINQDAGENPGDSKFETLVLHSVPKQLKYEPASNFVGIASIGRNNPHYNYAGSEDTLSFSIDWYCKGLDRAEVLRSCRWVEALSKSNGYTQRPPVVKIQWGDDDYLFGDDEWIVVSAGYELSNFQSYGMSTDTKTFRRGKDNSLYSIGGLPQQAYQNVVLKRVSNTNRTWEKIRNINALGGFDGKQKLVLPEIFPRQPLKMGNITVTPNNA